jgi:protein gp37
MAENSAIEWTDHTFNPWTGCARVSPGCDHCYAAEMAKRNPAAFGSWAPGAPRKRTSDANWRKPDLWNRKAEKEGRRARVFCASMADVFDNQADPAWRCDLWDLIWSTPHLDWLLLTKRPQNIAAMLPTRAAGALSDWGQGWTNVWLGTTAENQAEAERRIPHLLAVPAAKRFLSCEPLLGPITFRWAKWDDWKNADGSRRSSVDQYDGLRMLDWIIAGGESGPGARPSHPDWYRVLRDQCAAAGVPFFFKQWGEWASTPGRIGQIALHHSGHVAGPSDRARDMPADIRDDGKWRSMTHLGKKMAGALLDGVKHRAFPDA